MNSTRSTGRARARRIALTLLAVSIAGLAGCTIYTSRGLPAGTPIAQVRQSALAPTGEYALPGGGTRLEFARGSFGRETYMLDFDAQGRLLTSTQVLTEANFATIEPGMSSQDVRMRLGRPAHVFNVGWQNLQVWNYRFSGGDCVWFQVSIGHADQRVAQAGIGRDPACDGPASRE
jgi:hypothetical protein